MQPSEGDLHFKSESIVTGSMREKKIDAEGKYFHSRTEGEGKTIFN